jgi:hypothetical protein
VPAKVVGERLGHANIAITMDTYSHVRPGMDERAARRPSSGKEGSAKPLFRGGVTEGTRTPDLRDHNPTL